MLRELYRQPGFPVLQNRVYDTPEDARQCPKGDMRLVEDMTTGLVRNADFRAELMNYDSQYNNEQSLSPAFQKHMNAIADLVERIMGRDGLVEVGCGKGAFLELLLARGIDVTGFDPAYEGANPRVRRAYFSEELDIRGRGLILRHVLEHIDDPVAFLVSLAAANKDQGLIYIEVPCFDWICQKRAWFDIFYEHVNYFRLSDFKRIFGKLHYAGRTFGGQYLSIVADLSTLQSPKRDPDDPVQFPDDFLATLDLEAHEKSVQSVVWGAASKGVIFSLMRQLAGNPVDRLIDINKNKQGKFIPATGIEVMSPEKGLQGLPEGTTIHVMNPNYLDEIREQAGPRFICKGMSND